MVIVGIAVGCGGEKQEVKTVLPDIDLSYSTEREACADRNPLRNVYFGDTHVHTALSFDAYVHKTRLMPRDAYRYARGEAVLWPPLGADGKGTQSQQLKRPLDFAVVTDHAEFLAEVSACITDDNPVYGTSFCQTYRKGTSVSTANMAAALGMTDPKHSEKVCGKGGIDCVARAKSVWKQIRDAGEEYYDRTSACEFTTLIGYEYSGSTNLSNLHRNVIFRSKHVPDLPATYIDEPTPQKLWTALERDCVKGLDKCDVLAIPHNSNWSNGHMFKVEYPGAESVDAQREAAAFRNRMEPLVEVFQHKGSTECRNGFSGVLGAPDELCDFEQVRWAKTEDCGDVPGIGGIIDSGCVHRLDFVRNVLKEGLREEERIGANPYKLGMIGSTDTHSGTPGAVQEEGWLGHLGDDENESTEQISDGSALGGDIRSNSGGLAAVWAVENSREALFDAMKRKEVYATSGPRIVLRFFGGWEFDAELCDDSELLARGYAKGVPMGGDLAAPTSDSVSPRFVVMALQDTESLPLQRAQIIKGWLDADGKLHEKVYDVAGGKGTGSVDPKTCKTSGSGSSTLCTGWTDPDFDAAQRAFYYARVVENPRCRHTTPLCNALSEDERPAVCDDPIIQKTIQERAWSSPIWYSPSAS